MKLSFTRGASALALALASAPALADGPNDRIEALESRIEQLEETNRRLLAYLEAQGALAEPEAAPAAGRRAEHHAEHHGADAPARTAAHAAHHGQAPATEAAAERFVGLSADYSFRILDHAEGVNTRQLTQLQAMQSGELADRVTFSGGITALANYQESNSDTKFGWLMRHPTSANQIGETVSEFVVHSAQIAATARLTNDITAYVELLYDPEQSFGAGTITDLNRNQIQLRRGWVMWGDLEERPIYAAIGKMDTPFGLNDTVSPFTNSTNWHAFAGLAYGGLLGYYDNGLHLRAMAIQGGAQFRAHNSPVEDTGVPSRVNNFALDANYTADLGAEGRWLVGASYTHASAYCQAYPVFHFNPCTDNNPAWSVYSRLELGEFEVIGEYASTTEAWPGSASPAPQFAQFEAVETEAFTVGGRYWMSLHEDRDFALSGEFSRFVAGDDGAPWERQDQYVLGASYFVTPSVNLFGEVIHTKGWAPLNFLSGGNLPGGATWSERDAETNILTLGIQAAF
ncbi:hypothetical protein DDZ18_01520 [Marinicauda salina]|uniref:Porin n=1 Tax=Marinicauda salina TaxID=2135793 RepID=A0A2U2BWD1_9PROT|nr:hypothetical protein [Marinicauda salina]PWE18312.1 hypothetical protein DDZ18_01520 [Marinicauda salina]